MHFRGPALAALSIALALVTAACASTAPPSPSQFAPTASPTPAPVAGCWIATRGEYRLQPLQGGVATAVEIEDAARLIDARLEAMDMPQYEVAVEADGTIVVLLPPLEEDAATDVRMLIGSDGRLLFVPLPDDSELDLGDELPPGMTPLFGREAIREARAGNDEAGRGAMDITLHDAATREFADYTAANVGSRLAIAIDETIISTPVIQAAIVDGQVQISGGDEVDGALLATLMSFPVMPGTLEELSFDEVARPSGCPV